MTEAFFEVVVVALASYRVARAVSVDTISDRPRGFVYERAFRSPQIEEASTTDWDLVARGTIEAPEERIAPPVQTISTPWAYIYGLLSCPFCSGWWISLGAWAVWWNWAGTHPWMTAISVAGAQSIFAAKGT